MKPTITLPYEWTYPRFAFGQQTHQGLVIGLEYLPDSTLLGDTIGAGWRYSILPHSSSRFLKHFKGEDLPHCHSESIGLSQLINHTQALIAQIVEHPDYKRLSAQDKQFDSSVVAAKTALAYLSSKINSQHKPLLRLEVV
ncbi:hypothetical protein H6G76_32955 [Nostoc sp. FACHB-152]|uniref:hypothetical protein n=1 Tax=Nostoc sp. FACHB-152 TaxID=2692837 RepID=UPI001689589D|nr:hypothetical protein [Nostoc sp. FACHB-152]MBD2451847.1 hypothetical protein [Nostoc sp. FACHB-152]